ncbi:MAG TPA: A/G-specific adenine glycosylase [Polyangiaceae bacterium]|jgi:A/G-specific adenine glycosylase
MARPKRAHGSAKAQATRAALLAWYRRARRDLPWRRTRDPYAIWVSEVMLQQTRVETVVPYWQRFLAELPTVHALAEAPLDRVLALWSGLGYYRRARLLHRGARDVAENWRGELPRDAASLQSIAGIGRYTAGAIASIAFGEAAPIVDGNVARVLSRLDALEEDPASPAGKRALWKRAEELARGESPGDLNQALMELGATVCIPKNPTCDACPLRADCRALARGIVADLPRVARKAAPKRVALRCVVVEHRGAVVLGKRREDALYGGLWEPPLEPREQPGPKGATPCGSFVQVLTHRRLEIDVFYMKASRARKLRPFGDYERVEAVRFDAVPALALSTLAKRALRIGLGDRQIGYRRAE